MDSRGPPMYLHPRMTMAESYLGSVPGSIPINVPMGIPAPEVTGMPGVRMSSNHAVFSHKTDPNRIPEQQHYNQLPLRKEVVDEGRIETVVQQGRIETVVQQGRIETVVQPENSAPLHTEVKNVGFREVLQNVKTEEEEDIENFMEAAHDIFLKISSKEMTIKTAADQLGRPYSFVYTRFQEFCDNITGTNKVMYKVQTAKKKKKGKKSKKKSKRLTLRRSREQGKIYQCEECPAFFHTEYLIKTHSKCHVEGNESHNCTACGVVFPKLNKLMQHRIDFHQEALQCPHCDTRFTTVTSYKNHIITHTAGKPYPCDECDNEYATKYGLTNHKRSHTGEKPYMCGVCGKTFSTLNGVKSHRYLHLGGKEKPFECELCGKRYISNSALNDHINTHTGAKPYACNLCDQRFNFKANLRIHKMVHTGEQPFKCDICPAAFYVPIDLRNHKISHTGIKPFKCDMCDYACTRKSNMEFHKYTHTGETPFKCDVYGCNAEYSRPKSLKWHKLKHGPPPPKKCKVCREQFPDLVTLKRHMMSHTGEKPHTCEQCFKTFIDIGALKRHMYTHMYRPFAQKTKQVRQSKKNPPVKKPVSVAVAPEPKKWPPTEYQVPQVQVPIVTENGHTSQVLTSAAPVSHNTWNINAEYIPNLVNNAWPSTMDPDEFRRRLLHSFK